MCISMFKVVAVQKAHEEMQLIGLAESALIGDWLFCETEERHFTFLHTHSKSGQYSVVHKNIYQKKCS